MKPWSGLSSGGTSSPPDETAASGWEEDRALAVAAHSGDLGALERLIEQVRTPVFNLALRFLWQPEDAEDATQEILLRIVTHLHTFEGRAKFSTWAYRVASNYLIDTKRSRAERREVSFERAAESLRRGSREPDFVTAIEANEMAEEVKVGCTHAMLLCLNRHERLAFLLGEVVGLSGTDAAYVLDINPGTFRKRLSRAREAMRLFLSAHCGLMDGGNPCRCRKRIAFAGRAFAPYLHCTESQGVPKQTSIPELEASSLRGAERLVAIYRSNREREAPVRLLRKIRAIFRAR